MTSAIQKEERDEEVEEEVVQNKEDSGSRSVAGKCFSSPIERRRVHVGNSYNSTEIRLDGGDVDIRRTGNYTGCTVAHGLRTILM